MQKILLATIEYPPQKGGIARYVHAIKQVMGEQADVLFWENGFPGYKKMILKLWQSKKQYYAVWINHILPLGTAAMLAGCRYVIFMHGKDFDLARRNPWKRILSKQILLRADAIVTNTHALANEVQGFVGKRIQKPIVVHPTVRHYFIEKAKDRRKDHTEKEHINLITVSRLVKRKGHARVLEAIADLPNARYTIVGSGPYKQYIKKEIERYKLGNRVKMLDNISDEDLVELYLDSDIFVMPTTKTLTDREGFGIVYLEASVFGLPVIASDQPGIDEAVLDRVTGVLVRTDEDLKNAIKWLGADHRLRERMGQAGFQFVTGEFTREKQFSKLKRLCPSQPYQS